VSQCLLILKAAVVALPLLVVGVTSGRHASVHVNTNRSCRRLNPHVNTGGIWAGLRPVQSSVQISALCSLEPIVLDHSSVRTTFSAVPILIVPFARIIMPSYPWIINRLAFDSRVYVPLSKFPCPNETASSTPAPAPKSMTSLDTALSSTLRPPSLLDRTFHRGRTAAAASAMALISAAIACRSA
jgi:hypothetical protein